MSEMDYASRHFAKEFKIYDLADSYKEMKFFQKIEFRLKTMFSSEKQDYKAALKEIKRRNQFQRKRKVEKRNQEFQVINAEIQTKIAYKKSNKRREKEYKKIMKESDKVKR